MSGCGRDCQVHVSLEHTLWKLSTGREPLRWLPLSFSSAIVCTARTTRFASACWHPHVQQHYCCACTHAACSMTDILRYQCCMLEGSRISELFKRLHTSWSYTNIKRTCMLDTYLTHRW